MPLDEVAIQRTPCYNTLYVRVNVHFLLHDDATGNFRPFDTGKPCVADTSSNGYYYAQGIIGYCNDRQRVNPPLNLAPGNSLTPQPKRIEWVLHGVYYDQTSAMRPGLTASNNDFGPLCVQGDSIINLFIAEAIPTPYKPVSPTVAPCTPIGQTLDNGGFVYASNMADCNNYPAPAKLWAVVMSPWTNYITNGQPAWIITAAVNHELFHLLGLGHPFEGYSGCADAPPHPDSQLPNTQYNCWDLNPSNPHCDTQSKVSNNQMDYNNSQLALSPCQLGIAQGNLSSCLYNRYVLQCSSCQPTDAWFSLDMETYGPHLGLWLEGRAAFNVDYFRIDIDQLNSAGAAIPSAHYDVTKNYRIRREYLTGMYNFQVGENYRIKLTVYRNGCNNPSVYSQPYSPRFIRGRQANPGSSTQTAFIPGSTLQPVSRHD